MATDSIIIPDEALDLPGNVIPDAAFEQAQLESGKEAALYDRPAEALGQGFLRGATFGLSDAIQTGLGIRSPQELSRIREQSPGLSTTGELASILLPIGGGPLKAASPLVSGVAKLGSTVEHAIANKFAKEATKSTARKILEGAGAKGAGQALEGGFYGAGQVLTEASLGDPESAAENALSTIGLSTLLGGGSSAALHVLAPGLKAIAKNAAPASRSVLNKITGISDDASRVLRDSPEKIEELSQLGANKAEVFQSLSTSKAADMSKVVDDYTENLSTKIDDLLVKSAQSNKVAPAKGLFDEIRAEASKLAPDGIVATPEIRNYIQKLSDVESSLADIVKKNAGVDIVPEDGVISALQLNALKKQYQRAGYQAARQGDPVVGLYKRLSGISNSLFETHVDKELRQLNSGYQKLFSLQEDLAKYGFEDFNPDKLKKLITSNEPRFQEALPFLRKWDDLMGTTLVDEVKTARAYNQIASDDAFSKFQTGRSLLKVFTGSAVGGPLGAVAGAALEVPVVNQYLNRFGNRAIDVLSKADVDAFRKLGGLEAKVIDPYLKPYLSAKIAAMLTLQKEQEKADREVKSSISGFFEGNTGGTPNSLGAVKKFKGDSADELARQLKEMIITPGLLENQLTDQTQQLSMVAPEMTQRLIQKASEMVHFMYTKIPALQPEQGLFPSSVQVSQLSDRDRAKFERYLDAFDSPLGVFKDLKAKKISPEGLEVVKRFYPKMFDKARNELLAQAQKVKKNVSYQDKVMLSEAFDIAIDPSLRPENVQNFQKMFQNGETQQSPGEKPISPQFAESRLTQSEKVSAK